MYVLSGPSDLMPEEGLSRLQRRQLALLEAAQRQKEKDTQIAKIQMEAAISTGVCVGGVGVGAGGGEVIGVGWGSIPQCAYARCRRIVSKNKAQQTFDCGVPPIAEVCQV